MKGQQSESQQQLTALKDLGPRGEWEHTLVLGRSRLPCKHPALGAWLHPVLTVPEAGGTVRTVTPLHTPAPEGRGPASEQELLSWPAQPNPVHLPLGYEDS